MFIGYSLDVHSIIKMTSRLLFFKIQPYFARHAQASPLHIFTRPWHILQWMKDPEEWISNIVKLSHSDKYLPFQADSLLFPSTWPPLQFLMNLALVHAIQRTLPGTPPRALLRYFCIQSVMYEEWYRLLFRERRVVLGAVLSVLSFLATAKFVHDAAKVDRLAIVMVFPALVAGLVSCWMNVLLVNERVLASKKRSPKIISKRRSTRSGNVVNDNWSSQWGSESRSVWDEN
jgi:tryptophan-rich sensory protein